MFGSYFGRYFADDYFMIGIDRRDLLTTFTVSFIPAVHLQGSTRHA